MRVKFVSLRWIPAMPARVVQGVKNNQVPKGAIAGGNGSFVVINEPSRLILTLEDENGKRFEQDIIKTVKSINDWKKISEKRIEAIEARLKTEGTFELSDLPTLLKV